MQKYGFKNIALHVNGQIITGFADGDDVISGKRRVDPFSDKMGADGRMLVVENADKSGEIVFKLMQNSEGSAKMGAMFALQEKDSFGSVQVNWRNMMPGGESVTGTQGYIKKPADITRGAGANTEEWTIVVEDYESFFGHLSPLGAALNFVASAFGL